MQNILRKSLFDHFLHGSELIINGHDSLWATSTSCGLRFVWTYWFDWFKWEWGTILRCSTRLLVLDLRSNLLYVDLWQDVIYHFIDTLTRLSRSLMEVHLVLLGNRMCLILRNHPIIFHINLVTHDYNRRVLVLHLEDALHPIWNRLVWLLICYVEA